MDFFFPYKIFEEKDSDKQSTSEEGAPLKNKVINTCVGFETEELKKHSKIELNQLKLTVLKYFNSSQKFKNNEFLNLLKRINDELKLRHALIPDKDLYNLNFDYDDKKKTKFLGKKKRFEESIFEIDIPSFFNDININDKQKIRPITKLNEKAKVKSDSDSEEATVSDKKYNTKKKNIIKSIVIRLNKIEFEKGLFNEKQDLEFSSDYEELIHSNSKEFKESKIFIGDTFKQDLNTNLDTPQQTQKHFSQNKVNNIKLSQSMLNLVPEDLFFSLD